MKRHKSAGLSIAKNTNDILTAINNHALFSTVDKPNQTDDTYLTYDISCNEDFALHSKYYNWQDIFQFFVDHPTAKATLATKIIPINFLEFDPKQKVRIRFSLMPQQIKEQLEPNTPDIIDRIKAIDSFIEAGYDVHVNFSPVVYYDNWIQGYQEIWEMMNDYIEDSHKQIVKAEVIFLTHNVSKHIYNSDNSISGEELLYNPDIQEMKTSEYGGRNIRYRHDLKKEMISKWTKEHDRIIPWNTIRYIF
jgi:spore photoproduct lyase